MSTIKVRAKWVTVETNGNLDEFLQRAVDVAGESGCGVVTLSAGRWRLTRPLVLRSGVTLRGTRAPWWRRLAGWLRRKPAGSLTVFVQADGARGR